MNDKYFRCFSVPLKNYLLSNDVKYELVALDTKSKNTFWLFVKTDKFQTVLSQWKK